MERHIFNMLWESQDPDVIIRKEAKSSNRRQLWDATDFGEEEKEPQKKKEPEKIEVIENISEGVKDKKPEVKKEINENKSPLAKPAVKGTKVKEGLVLPETEAHAVDYLIYLGKNMDRAQLYDFLVIVSNLQKDYQRFMDTRNNAEFARVYNDMKEAYKEKAITFDTWKRNILYKLSALVYPDEKETLMALVLSILLHKDKKAIYDYLEQDSITKGVECGNYFAF